MLQHFFIAVLLLINYSFCQENQKKILYQDYNFDSSLYQIYLMPANNHEKSLNLDSIFTLNMDSVLSHSNFKFKSNKLNPIELPKNWIPIYEFDNQLCLYDPCDGIFNYQVFLTDSTFYWMNFEELTPYPILNWQRKEINKWKFTIGLFDINTEFLTQENCMIYKSDKGYMLCLNNELYVNRESIENYPIIINDCSIQKWTEFHELKTPDIQKYMIK